MKTLGKIAAALTFIVGLGFTSAQADPVRHRSRSRILQQDETERYVYVTGSHIPQKLALKSIGTTTPYNLRIYTKAELDSTGRQTVAGALSIDPSITISGH